MSTFLGQVQKFAEGEQRNVLTPPRTKPLAFSGSVNILITDFHLLCDNITLRLVRNSNILWHTPRAINPLWSWNSKTQLTGRLLLARDR